MTIDVNDLIIKSDAIFDAASSSASVSNNAFSIATDQAQWTNALDAPLASIMFECTFGTAPAANSGVNLYFRKIGIDGANDARVPNVDFRETFIGFFPVDTTTVLQRITLSRLSVPVFKDSSVFELYTENFETGQTISAGWRYEITPQSLGVKV